MKRFLFITSFCILLACQSKSDKNLKYDQLGFLENRLKVSLEKITAAQTNKLASPRSFIDGKIQMVPSSDWTSGFYAGELWLMFELTQDDFWKNKALAFTMPIEEEKWNGKTHDMGFKVFCSFGRAYKSTGDPHQKEVLIQAAKTLASRFKPNVGCLRSWDHNADKWDYPVIIDNMMNLELLFWAAKETGNELYKQIAVSHARTTMKNHFRDDFSSYHVVDYDPVSGQVQGKATHQGFATESAWSRGQAWGLYGYTMVYRETQIDEFLQQAIHIADYILEHPTLKNDIIPYWDFDAPEIPNEPKDASAAAIICSALYELSGFIENDSVYRNNADKIFATLSSDIYLSDMDDPNGFILKHSTGSKPHNSEVDVPIVYADYYYLEALKRKLNKAN